MGDCAALVSNPVDSSPIRSPQRVHTVLLPLLSGREVVEVGTRNGDGMMCFSHSAKRATAIELYRKYCRKLQGRTQLLNFSTGKHFSVHCAAYQAHIPDGDVYTWWQQPPHIVNSRILAHLACKQALGRIRQNAEALVLFDMGFGPDRSSLAYLRKARWVNSSHVIDYNESSLCLSMYSSKKLCARAAGRFTVARIELKVVVRQPSCFLSTGIATPVDAGHGAGVR